MPDMTDEELHALFSIPDKESGLYQTWFANYTFIPGEKTLDPSVRSYPQLDKYGNKAMDKNPWMSPGSAPVFSPCGALGGNPEGLVGTSEEISFDGGFSY